LKKTTAIFGTAIAALAVAFMLAGVSSAEDGFRKVTGPCRLSFPQDHGAHRGYKTEWWYYTGNLGTETGVPLGFQLTFFRTALRAPDPVDRSLPRSNWRTSQLFIGHAAITDIDSKTHFFAEITAREALDMAGVRTGNGTTTVFVRGWRTDIAAGIHRLQAVSDKFSLDLTLTPEKPPVRHGEEGYSRKGTSPARASCYYSLTRLAAAGRIRIGARQRNVSGLAWMDHEFSTAPLEPGLVGWDWFSLQFSDRCELMVYMLRNEDGSFHPASAGTFVDAGGKKTHLERNRLVVKAIDRWKSPETGADYPVRWRLSVSDPDLNLLVTARVNDQEMDTRRTTGVVYWEGSVAVEGTAAGQPVTGVGYVETTGYAQAFDAPM
jgi:predicted secreted hydrolase